ncbi:MAG: DsbA family protein [Polyangiales bacterium]
MDRRRFLIGASAIVGGCVHRDATAPAMTTVWEGEGVAHEELSTPAGTLVVRDDIPTDGPKRAHVAIAIFSDFQCPFCAQLAPSLRRVLREREGRVRLVFLHAPLSIHAYAREAAIVAQAVWLVGGASAFWAMHDRLFAEQMQIDQSTLVSWSTALGAAWNEIERVRPRAEAIVDRCRADARRLGVQGVPHLFIGATSIEGVQPYEVLMALVDEANDA